MGSPGGSENGVVVVVVVVAAAAAAVVGGLCRTDRKSQKRLRSDRARCLKFRDVGCRNGGIESENARSSLDAPDSCSGASSSSLEGPECTVVRHCRYSD